MSSKKNKKSKGVTMSLADFAARVDEGTGNAPPGPGKNMVYADKKPKMPVMSSWADEVEEDGSFYEKIILPSAPRASRGPAYDDSEIPRNPPFTAHLGNLPYDISDEEIYKFFRDVDIGELKLPRDQQTQRLRGFGYVDFNSRGDLIEALTRNEQMLRGRPIRITLGTGQQQDRRGGPDMDRGGMRDGERRRRPPAEDDDVDDWRSVMKPQGFESEPEFRRGPPSGGGGDYGSMPRSGGYNRDRGYGPPRDRDRRGPPPPEEEIEFSRSQMMQPPPPGQQQQYYNTYGGRGSGSRGYQQQYQGGRDRDYYDNRGGGDRDREHYGGERDRDHQGYYRGGQGHSQHGYSQSSHSRHHSESSDAETGGTWRRREHTVSQSSQNSSHNYGPSSSSHGHPPEHGYHQRSESPPMHRTSDSPDDEYDRDPPSREASREDASSPDPPQPQPPKERKRLVLQPRTVEKPPGEVEAGSSSIFGGAKPVDTQKREREIEEKLEKLKVVEEPEPRKEEGQEESSEDTPGASGGSIGEDGGSSSGPPQRQQSRGERERGDRERGERGDRDRGERGDRDRGDRDRERGDRDRGERGDRDRGDRERGERGGQDGRPKQFRLLTRNNSGSTSGKEAYIDVQAPFESVKGPGLGGLSSTASSSSSRTRLPLQQPPPLSQAYTSQRFNLRSDDKDRGHMERGGPYRGGRGGPGGRRDMDQGPRGGRGGEFRRGPGRDHDGPSGGRGGRSFDRDHGGGGGGRGGRGGYNRDDYGGGRGGDRGDDFRRGPPHHSSHHPHHSSNNNQSSSIGSHSEERDRDSHSEPEDDRDMMRGGGDKGGDYSDDSGDFTRVERRGRKNCNNRTSNNPPPPPNPNNNRQQPRERTFY